MSDILKDALERGRKFLESEDFAALMDAIDQATKMVPPGPWLLPLAGTVWAAKGARRVPQMERFLAEMAAAWPSLRRRLMPFGPSKLESGLEAYWRARRKGASSRISEIIYKPFSRPDSGYGGFGESPELLLYRERAARSAKARKIAPPKSAGDILVERQGRASSPEDAPEFLDTLTHEGMHGIQALRTARRGIKEWYPKNVPYDKNPMEIQAFAAGERAKEDFRAFVEALTALYPSLGPAAKETAYRFLRLIGKVP